MIDSSVGEVKTIKLYKLRAEKLIYTVESLYTDISGPPLCCSIVYVEFGDLILESLYKDILAICCIL